jgi:glycosyltransferase involved in cell wall biosynthesis
MKIWVYTLTFNESHFVKNFLRAYKDVEKIIVYDNMSTDNTVSLLKEDPRVEVRINDSGGKIRDDIYLQIKNNCWKEARGLADWVIICDFDEIFTHALPPNEFNLDLSELGPFSENVDIIQPFGYMIYSTDMLMGEDYNPLYQAEPLKGIYDANSEKLCCFRPDKIAEINYTPGCHDAAPVGIEGHSPLIHHYPEFKLIHFKYINIKTYFDRLMQYSARMSAYNLAHGYGIHYTWSFNDHMEIYLKGIRDSKPLFEIQKP